MFIKAGASVNERDKDGWTALMCAARFNSNPKIIITLLNAGADGKAKDENGNSAFDHAKENEKLKGTPAYWALNDARF